jgi:hypothetical protein
MSTPSIGSVGPSLQSAELMRAKSARVAANEEAREPILEKNVERAKTARQAERTSAPSPSPEGTGENVDRMA